MAPKIYTYDKKRLEMMIYGIILPLLKYDANLIGHLAFLALCLWLNFI